MDQLPPGIINSIPSKWLVYINAAVAVYWMLDHVVQILAKNNGLVGLWRKIIYGSPDSKKIEQIDAHLQSTDSIVVKDLKQSTGTGGAASPPEPKLTTVGQERTL